MNRSATIPALTLVRAVNNFRTDAVKRAAAEVGFTRAKALGTVGGPDGYPKDGTVGAVILRRNDARKLLDACLTAADKNPEKRGLFLDAAQSLAEGIEILNREIDAAATAEHRADPVLGFVEVRSGADWQAAFRDPWTSPMDEPVGGDERFGLRDFCAAVAGLRATETAKRSLSVGTDAAGGFTVPSSLMPSILDALAPASSVLTAGASILVPTDDAKQYRIAAVETLPTAAWRNEGADVAESDPAFRAVDVVPRSLAFYFRVTRELLTDATADLDRALRTAIAAAFAAAIDLAALRGTGTAPQPRGILNTPGVHSVTNGANGTSLGTIRWSNLLDAVRLILNANAPAPTAAVMAPRTLTGFAALADTTNQPLRRPPLLEAMRFVATSQIPVNLTVGSSSDCSEVYVGDFTNLRIVMREAPSIQVARETFATTGQVAFVCHARIDIAVLRPTAFVAITGVRP